MTEIVVDDDGRPLHLTFHRWAIPSMVGENDFVEGVVNARFSLIGGPISILSIDGQDPTTRPSVEGTDRLTRTPLPGIGVTVLFPAGATTEERGLTYYSQANRASGIDLTYLVASSDGLRGTKSASAMSRRPSSRARPRGTGSRASSLRRAQPHAELAT